MSKYYTPDKEEFCWGFEYESEEDPVRGIWEKQVVGAWSKFKYFDDDSDVDYRVKYLDKEDIESLGFTLDKVSENRPQELFYKDNIMLIYRYNAKTLSIFTRDPSKNEVYMKSNIDPYCVNNIIIKNKSELKKLMQQLNIK